MNAAFSRVASALSEKVYGPVEESESETGSIRFVGVRFRPVGTDMIPPTQVKDAIILNRHPDLVRLQCNAARGTFMALTHTNLDTVMPTTFP